MRYIDKDLDSIQEMRNLLLNAQSSFVQLQHLAQRDLDTYCNDFIEELRMVADQFIHQFVTGNNYGFEEDEVFLYKNFIDRFKAAYIAETYVGIIKGNTDDKLIEIGVPLGCVAILLPSHPSFSLLVNSILLAMKSGNSLVIVANKLSKKATTECIKDLIAIVEKVGYLKGAISLAETISDDGVRELFNSNKLSLIINVGCPEFITRNFRTNTAMIYGGESSGPVFIERSADIEQAIKDLIFSRSFNNGIMPGSEQFLVTENFIKDSIKEELVRNGAYLLDDSETKKLICFLKRSEKNVIDSYVGKTAIWIAKMAGISVPDTTKVLVSVQDYITEEDFFSQKLLCPIIVVYLEPDWTLACTKCMALLAELKMGHTLTIHSQDWRVIKEFATVKKVGRMVVNGPTVCSATGIISNFSPSLILGGLTTGRGYCSENITPKHLTYTRRIGFR